MGLQDGFLWTILVTAVAGIGGTGLGGVVSAFIRRDSKRTVSLLLSFAGGVMLAVVCFDLVLDALFTNGTADVSRLPLILLGIAVGYAVVAGLNYLIDRRTEHARHGETNHPTTADDLDELIHSDHYAEHKRENDQLFVAGIIMAAAIALHNLPEGMVIGAAYASDAAAGAAGSSGLLIAVVIGLHNIPEGMAVAVPLIAGGMGRGKAILTTALSGAPTVIGAMIGFLLGAAGPFWHVASLSFASGAMLYVVFGELLPESILMWRSKLPALAIVVGMLVGLGIIFA